MLCENCGREGLIGHSWDDELLCGPCFGDRALLAGKRKRDRRAATPVAKNRAITLTARGNAYVEAIRQRVAENKLGMRGKP